MKVSQAVHRDFQQLDEQLMEILSDGGSHGEGTRLLLLDKC